MYRATMAINALIISRCNSIIHTRFHSRSCTYTVRNIWFTSYSTDWHFTVKLCMLEFVMLLRRQWTIMIRSNILSIETYPFIGRNGYIHFLEISRCPVRVDFGTNKNTIVSHILSFLLFHILMPYNIIHYFRLPYFHVSNSASFST